MTQDSASHDLRPIQHQWLRRLPLRSAGPKGFTAYPPANPLAYSRTSTLRSKRLRPRVPKFDGRSQMETYKPLKPPQASRIN